MTGLDELLADCDARGIRLLPSSDGGLTLDAPQDAVTPELLDGLRQHKSELLKLLRVDLGCRSDCDRLVREMMKRVCQAVPASCELWEQDWRRLDVIHERINRARHRSDVAAVVTAIAEYEKTVGEMVENPRIPFAEINCELLTAAIEDGEGSPWAESFGYSGQPTE